MYVCEIFDFIAYSSISLANLRNPYVDCAVVFEQRL